MRNAKGASYSGWESRQINRGERYLGWFFIPHKVALFSFLYTEGNNLAAQTNPNGTEDRILYNEANQIIETRTVDTNSNAKFSSKYQYNQDGRLVNITGVGPGNPSADYVYNNGTEKLNRLTKATITEGTTPYTFNYAYDPAGNILSMDSPKGSNSFTYTDDNQIATINGSAQNVSYDANGNLTKATLNGKTYLYSYDAANRLQTVKDGAGTTIASFTYDGDGRRLTKTANGETITYHYFGDQLQYETSNSDPAGTIRARYIWTPSGKLLSVVLGSDQYYYHYNAHGDVAAVTDSNGNVYRQYVYDPYGNVISVKDGAGNAITMSTDTGFNHAYTYAGYRYDKESGLYFLNARYYNPEMGRFLTKDSVIGQKGNPKTFNPYSYSSGDPVNYVDPDGTFAIAIPLVYYGALEFVAIGLMVYTAVTFDPPIQQIIGSSTPNVGLAVEPSTTWSPGSISSPQATNVESTIVEARKDQPKTNRASVPTAANKYQYSTNQPPKRILDPKPPKDNRPPNIIPPEDEALRNYAKRHGRVGTAFVVVRYLLEFIDEIGLYK